MEQSEIRKKINAIIYDKLAVQESEVTRDKSFRDLSADSLDTVELIMEFEKEFGINLPDDEYEKITTVGNAYDLIEAKIKAKNKK